MAFSLSQAISGFGGSVAHDIDKNMENERAINLVQMQASIQRERDARLQEYAQGNLRFAQQLQQEPLRNAEKEITERIGAAGTDERGLPMVTSKDQQIIKMEAYRKAGRPDLALQMEHLDVTKEAHEADRRSREAEGAANRLSHEKINELTRDTQLKIAELARSTQRALADIGATVATDGKTGNMFAVGKDGQFRNWIKDKDGNNIQGTRDLSATTKAMSDAITRQITDIDRMETTGNPSQREREAFNARRMALNASLINLLSGKELPGTPEPTELDIQGLRERVAKKDKGAISFFDSQFGTGAATRILQQSSPRTRPLGLSSGIPGRD